MLPLEFIPPTIVVVIALVVWLLARLNRNLSAPAQSPGRLQHPVFRQTATPAAPAERETPVEDFFAPIAETYPETAGELQLELSDAEVDDRFAAMVAAENARAAFPRRWPYLPKHRRSQEGPS